MINNEYNKKRTSHTHPLTFSGCNTGKSDRRTKQKRRYKSEIRRSTSHHRPNANILGEMGGTLCGRADGRDRAARLSDTISRHGGRANFRNGNHRPCPLGGQQQRTHQPAANQ